MSEYRLFTNGRVITTGKEFSNGAVFIKGSRIIAVGSFEEIEPLANSETERIDVEGSLICPGLVDVHLHGFGGYDASAGSQEAIVGMADKLACYGTTSFLPTIIGGSFEEMAASITAVHQSMHQPAMGARPLGIFLEGPFINPDRRGAAPLDRVRKPNRLELLRLLGVAANTVRMIIVSPELPGASEIIREAVEHGVTVAFGHSSATYEQAMAAISLGATQATHTFNGMSGFHHRKPGVLGAILTDSRVFAEITVDLIHLHPATVQLTVKAKGVEKVCLISDSMYPGGLPDGSYDSAVFGTINKQNGGLMLNNGTIVGSAISVNMAVKNMVGLGFSIPDSIRMGSLNPARAIGLTDIGDLQPGDRADIAVFDESFNAKLTMVDGKIVYRA